jgi:dihydroorotate dehydrogenase (fumarate)
MVALNSIDISPPLLNSSCAWSSDLHQLRELYTSTYTGAITTRTATVDGFQEDVNHTVPSSPAIVYLHYSVICLHRLPLLLNR